MTTYAQLEEAAHELEIGLDIGEEVRNIPRLHNRWMRYLTEFNIKVHAQEKKVDEITSLRQEWYEDRVSPTKMAELGWEPYNLGVEKSNRSISAEKMKRLLEGDGIINAEREKLFHVSLCREFCEDKLKVIMQRGQHLKTLLDWEKFKAGVY
jgi:hypothetical protein